MEIGPKHTRSPANPHIRARAHTHNKAGQMKSKRAQTFIRESHFLPLSCTSQFLGGEERSGGWEGGLFQSSSAAQVNNLIKHVCTVPHVCTFHPSPPLLMPLCRSTSSSPGSSLLSVWQGRGQRAAGRLSRWAASRGGGPGDAPAALRCQSHNPAWVSTFPPFLALCVLLIRRALFFSKKAQADSFKLSKQNKEVWMGQQKAPF